MEKKELILQTLEKMGYKPSVDNDGDIMLRYQMKTVFVMLGDDDAKYVSVLLPQFHEIEDGEEPLVLTVCNKMTRELKLVKVYVDQTFKNISASCEFFFANDEALEMGLANSLKMLGVVKSIFRRNRQELAAD